MPILCLLLISMALYESLSEEYWGLHGKYSLSRFCQFYRSKPMLNKAFTQKLLINFAFFSMLSTSRSGPQPERDHRTVAVGLQ